MREWFPTLIHEAPLLSRGAGSLNLELSREAAQIRDFDEAGRHWSEQNYPQGYTSYGSLDHLHRFSSTFLRLERAIDRRVAAFVSALHWDLRGARLTMSDCWLNIMGPGSAHSLHLHPQSVLSGTYYVATPRGCPGLKFEDPRLSRMMASPMRSLDAPPGLRPHISYPARAGRVILFESWLRHEVPRQTVHGERISISFNYQLG